MALSATSAAQYSLSPLARVFQIITMAMQRGKPNDDDANCVLRFIRQEDEGQDEHQDRPDDPVLQKRKTKHLFVVCHLADFFIFHPDQRRVHHQNQPYRDRP